MPKQLELFDVGPRLQLVQPGRDVELCDECGMRPATLLCDFILNVETLDDRDRWKDLRTCDRPLCRACAVNAGVMIICGSECGSRGHRCLPDTTDYCPQCAAKMRGGGLLKRERR